MLVILVCALYHLVSSQAQYDHQTNTVGSLILHPYISVSGTINPSADIHNY